MTWTHEIKYVSAQKEAFTGDSIIRDSRGAYVGTVGIEYAMMIAAVPDLLDVVRAMATFDGRNNNAALKEMARVAISKAERK